MDGALAAIAAACPRSTGPAQATLVRLAASWGPGPWHSCLTPRGQPIELAFRGGQDEVRLTAESAAPGADTAEKWRGAEALVPGLEPEATPLLRLLAAQPGQRWGLWVGFTHRDATVTHKLYQEVAPAARSLVRVPMADAIPLIAAADVTGRASELYCRLISPGPQAVHRALSLSEAGNALPLIENCFGELRGRVRRAALDGLRLGVSFRSAPSLVTVFAHATELFVDDADARTRLLRLGDRLGVDMRAYRDATAHMRSHPGAPAHGTVSLTPLTDGEVALSIGVSGH